MSQNSIFQECFNQGGDDITVLQCVSLSLEDAASSNRDDMNQWFFIYSAALVFFMQAGFAMLCAGCVRLKNVQNTMLKNLLDACGAAVSFFAVGYAFAFGGQFDNPNDTTFIGHENFFMMGVDNYAFWVFEFAFAATSATIVAGTLAERCQMAAYLLYSMVLTGFVYPVVAHSIWSNNGFLSAFNSEPLWDSGMVDFAGGGVVHTTGGFTALFATLLLGPRKGRFYDTRGNPLEKPKPFPGHSMALQMLGTFILWFGWYGFNPGSALTLQGVRDQGKVAALAAVNTTLSAACGCIVSLFCNLFIRERLTGEFHFDLPKAMNGSLAGLVAITAGCSTVEPWAATVIGGVAGLLYLGASQLLVKRRIDDVVDAIPVHLANGLWGVLAVGLFTSPSRLLDAYNTDKHVGWFYSWGRGSADATLLACQIVGILFILGWVFAIMFPFFVWLNYVGWFRADSLEELVGLDISYHGGSVRPDSDTEVKLEYVEALNRQRNLRRRRSSRNSHESHNNVDESGAFAATNDNVSGVDTAGSTSSNNVEAVEP